jgi:four helix bundle suffix protein
MALIFYLRKPKALPMNQNSEGFLPPSGGYQNLLSYKKAEIIFDGTVYFTSRFFRYPDRTIDQMVQAARSGKQNIAEGSVISATSTKLELNLTNVARASLEELAIDYTDFLRIRNLSLWPKEHRLVARLRELNRTPNANYATFKKAIEHDSPEICANTMFTLIKITTYLLTQQIKHLEKKFLEEGGLNERMYHARRRRLGGN